MRSISWIVGTLVLLHFLTCEFCDRTRVRAQDKRADRFPKVTLRTQDDEEVKFYDDLIKDKIVIINFMYTQCKGICVEGTKNLVQVQKSLGTRLGSDVFMYSISLEPDDTPKRLREYLKQFEEAHGARPNWTFLTSLPKRADDISALRNSLGLGELSPRLRSELGLDRPLASEDNAGGRSHSGMIVIRNDAIPKSAMALITSSPALILEKVERVRR